MTQMLRHKTTGELFIYTDAYAKLPELELVVEDPVAKIVAEVAAQDSAKPAQDIDSALNAALETPALGKPSAVLKKHGK